MTPQTPVLPLVRGSDGVWEALITPVHGSADIMVLEDLHVARSAVATVRVAGEPKTLTVFEDVHGSAVVRYADALPD